MSSIKSIKIGVISATAAFGLLAGGLLLGGSLAGAQTPPAETPSPQTVPADPGTPPRNDGTTPRGDKECDEDRTAPSGSSSGASSGLRRSGPSGARF